MNTQNPPAEKRVRGFVLGKSRRNPKQWVVQVSDTTHPLFRKNIRVKNMRPGKEVTKYDSVDFVVLPGSGKLVGFAKDVAKIQR